MTREQVEVGGGHEDVDETELMPERRQAQTVDGLSRSKRTRSGETEAGESRGRKKKRL